MEKLLTLQITIFLLMATGFLVKRLGIVGDQGQKNLTDLVIYVILPCNILKAFLTGRTDGMFFSFLSVFLISAGIQVFCLFYARLVFRKEPEGRKTCLQYGTICSNAGFLGNPVAEGAYGAEGLLIASIYLIPLRIMMWTGGIALFNGAKDPKKTLFRVLTHPCIIATIIGILFMLTGLDLPAGLMNAVTSISNCNTALSMMVIGMILEKIKAEDLLDLSVWRFSFHRLVVIPAVVLLICRCLPVSRTVTGVSVLLAAMPAGATTGILAEKYQVEPAFAAKTVILSTLLSLPSIAAWCFLLQKV